jgi:hypothetical protein
MCLSPPLAGQPHWKTGRANVMVSLNGIDTTNYDSTCPYDGCVDYFYTTPRKWEFILREYLMGFIFTIVTVIYVAVRRQQYIKNNAKYVSDTGGEWEKPNLKEALMWQNEHQVRKYGHQQYKIYKTTSAELGTLGVGIGLYFEYLKIMTRYFIIMSLLAVPSIFINSRGQAYGNRDDIEFAIRASLGNIGNGIGDGEITLLDFGGDAVVKYPTTTVSLLLAVLDCVISLVWILGTWRLKIFQEQAMKDIDEDTITAADYTVLVESIPNDALDPEEFKAFFSRYGEVQRPAARCPRRHPLARRGSHEAYRLCAFSRGAVCLCEGG